MEAAGTAQAAAGAEVHEMGSKTQRSAPQAQLVAPSQLPPPSAKWGMVREKTCSKGKMLKGAESAQQLKSTSTTRFEGSSDDLAAPASSGAAQTAPPPKPALHRSRDSLGTFKGLSKLEGRSDSEGSDDEPLAAQRGPMSSAAKAAAARVAAAKAAAPRKKPFLSRRRGNFDEHEEVTEPSNSQAKEKSAKSASSTKPDDAQTSQFF